jgi:N4-gp56 family major capsid protein
MAFTTTQVGSTEDTVILSIVQEQLLSKAVVRPTVMDMSSQATKGVKSIEIPKFDTAFGAPSVQNPDGVTPVAFKTLDIGVDALNLDQWKNLPYRIPDRISIQNRVSLEAELAASAGKEMAIDLDEYVIAQLRLASDANPDHDIALDGNPDADQAGAAPSAITLPGINEARKLLKKQNVTDLDGGMVLLVSVEQEANMLNIDNFISAEKYGSREALLNGEIGRVYGMRVVVSNLLGDNEAFAYHRSCMAFAAQKDVSFERQRSDVTLQAWEYSFSVGYGATILDSGKRVVYMHKV